jgi:hypothetical protein
MPVVLAGVVTVTGTRGTPFAFMSFSLGFVLSSRLFKQSY